MADRIITFQYARDNYDAYKKQTIPASNECMTKADVAAYLNADMSVLSSYTNNQLVPRVKVVGQFPFTVQLISSEKWVKEGVNSFSAGIGINYSGGTGKIYPPNAMIVPMTSAGGVANYSVTNLGNKSLVISGNGTIWVTLYVTEWYSNDSFFVHIPIQADESGTPIAIATITVRRRNV